MVQKGLCYYCGSNLIELGESKTTKDHVIPKSEGGGKKGNLVLACETCNTLKRSYPADKFMGWIEKHKKTIQDYNSVFKINPQLK